MKWAWHHFEWHIRNVPSPHQVGAACSTPANAGLREFLYKPILILFAVDDQAGVVTVVDFWTQPPQLFVP
jgi:hypothetical protein